MANKPGEANFFPDVPVYPEMGTFQPVYGKFDLTTYIQGASDYEIMAFLVGKYNACLEAYGNITKLSTETITACKQLQDWINSWFTNLDVQEEINKKLDSMVADGSFGTLLHQTFDAQVNQQAANTTTAWLVANVTPTGSAVIVDKSLTIKGAAADSYVTGTKLNAIAKITISANMMNPSKFQNGLIGYDYHDSVTNLSENPDYYSIIFDGTFPKGTVFLFSRELGTDYPYQRFIQFNPSTNIVTASYRVQDKGDTGLYEIATTEDNKGIAITFGKAYKDLYVATKSSYLENPKILPYGATDVELLADVGTDNLESKSVTAEKLNDDVIKLIKTNVIIDPTLTLKGAAADAYETGKRITSNKTKLNAIAAVTISANMMNPSKFQNGLIGYDYHDSVTNLSENPDYYSIIFDGTFPKGTVFLFSRELGTDYPYQRFIQFNPSTNIVTASYRVQDKGDTGLYEIATTEDNKGIAITFGKAYKDLYVATKSSYLENPKILPYGATDVELLADVGTDNLESKSVTAEKLNDDVIKLIKTKNDNPCDYEGGDISAFDTCVCIGDSLTEGIFNVNKLESSRTYPTMNYPSYLQKITGVNVTNNGSGGKTTVTWWNAFKNTDLSGYKMAIIALGVNDYYSYGADWTAAANEALGEIVQKLQNENNNIKIFVSTILPAKYYPASQYTKISQGIRDFVKNKNDANVICLDIAKYGHTNDKDAYNTGHLSAYGYWRLAKDYANYISWYMNNNSEVFKEIQFIGTDLTSGY